MSNVHYSELAFQIQSLRNLSKVFHEILMSVHNLLVMIVQQSLLITDGELGTQYWLVTEQFKTYCYVITVDIQYVALATFPRLTVGLNNYF